MCCSPWGYKESDTTEQLNNNSISWTQATSHMLLSALPVKPHLNHWAMGTGLWPHFVAENLKLTCWGSQTQKWLGQDSNPGCLMVQLYCFYFLPNVLSTDVCHPLNGICLEINKSSTESWESFGSLCYLFPSLPFLPFFQLLSFLPSFYFYILKCRCPSTENIKGLSHPRSWYQDWSPSPQVLDS